MEPRREQEQRFSQDHKLATKLALAFVCQMPNRNMPEYYAPILLDQILLQGNDSRLYQALMQQRGHSDGVSGGGINAVTPQKMNKTAREYMRPEAMTIVVVDDKKPFRVIETAFSCFSNFLLTLPAKARASTGWAS